MFAAADWGLSAPGPVAVGLLCVLLAVLLRRVAPAPFAPGLVPRIPGARNYPLAGYLPYLARQWDHIALRFLEVTRARKWQTWAAPAPNVGGLGGGLLVLTTPAAVRHMLKDNFDNYQKGPLFRAWFSDQARNSGPFW